MKLLKIVLLFSNIHELFLTSDKQNKKNYMTPEQIYLVQSSWQHVFAHATKFTKLFFKQLFEIDPDLESQLKPHLHQQFKKLFSMVNLILKSLKDLDSLMPVIQSHAIKHVDYGVQDKDYDTVGKALLLTLEQHLGEDFNESTKEAWSTAYTELASVMKTAADEALNDNATN